MPSPILSISDTKMILILCLPEARVRLEMITINYCPMRYLVQVDDICYIVIYGIQWSKRTKF